jgi:DNA-binding beta-propeller fold protein YncE
MSRVLCALLACAAGLATACFNPALDGFACGPDRGCPKGYECSANNMCVPSGTDPGVMLDSSVPVDPPDAGPIKPGPAATILFPLPVGMTEADSIIVRGTATHDSPIRAVRVNGIVATSANAFLDWSVEVPLQLGANVLRVETEDEADVTNPDAASVSVLRTSTLVFEPSDIAVSPGGNLAVVFDLLTDALLTVDLATGERTFIADDDTGTGRDFQIIEQLAVDSMGATAYAVDSSDVTVLAIDLATGNRDVVSGDAAGGGEGMNDPTAIALDEVNGTLLVGDDGDNTLLAIDIATGERTVLSGVDSGGTSHGAGPELDTIEAIVFDAPNNRVLVADSGLVALVEVDLATGNREILSDDATGAGPNLVFPVGVALGANAGEAFVADEGRGAIVRVDLANAGDRSVVSGSQTGSGVPLSDVHDLAMHPDGQRLLVVDDGHLVPLVVDVATGARSLIAAASVGSGPALGDPEGVVLDAARGRLLIPDDDLDGVLAMELATGNRTLLGDDTDYALLDPEAIALDPAGNRAVVLDSTLDACIAIDLDTGVRTDLSSDAFGGGPQMSDPQSVVLDEAGTTAWIADPGPGRRAVLSVNLTSATRELLSDNNLQTANQLDFPDGIILDQARNRVVVVDSGRGDVMTIDLTSGERTLFGTGGAGPDIASPLGLAPAGPDSALVYDDETAVYLRLDLATGERAAFGPAELRAGVSFGSAHIMMVDTARNVLVIADEALSAVIAVDLTTSERLIISR